MKSTTEQPKFIIDAMLGELTRWLRLLGYDSVYCENESDDEILAKTQSRILLTRDKRLLERAHARGYKALNPGESPIQQMLQRIQNELGIYFAVTPKKSRCPHCNGSLTLTTRVEVQDHVPRGSLQHHEEFWQCQNPSCQKVYWQGRHWTKIKDTLNHLDS